MALIESKAYRDGFSEEAFMQSAGKGVALATAAFFSRHPALPKAITLLCGKGNNGGDAYVAGIYLIDLGYTVSAYQIVSIKDCSPLCQKHHALFLEKGGRLIKEETFPRQGAILDGIFGTGFKGSIKEPYAGAIRLANNSGLPILAIDVPSGLNGDTGAADDGAIFAKETFFLGLPKTGFFLQEGWDHVGKIRAVDFGLPAAYIDKTPSDFVMLTPQAMAPLLPRLVNSRHKYQAGYVVGLAGSPGMPGAALLASKSTLRSGAGIVKLLHPKGMESELSGSFYELIKVGYEKGEDEKILELMNGATATFIGPGIGRSPQMKKLLQRLLPELQKPCVLDADALSLIAEDKIPFPQQTILTPHLGEMIRLLKHSAPHPHTTEFLLTCQRYCEEHHVTLILKGGPTFIFHPDQKISVNPRGDPGMATAGSGDVLTGILSALLAQKKSPHEAALLGVTLHGISGEYAAEKMSSYSLMAGDLIDHLPQAFLDLL